MFDQRSELGGKDDLIWQDRVVEGFDPETVAGEHQRAGRRVPDREGEHALQVIKRSEATVLVPVYDHFGIRACRERMAARGEVCPELAVVVDLAVEDDPDAPPFARHRLVAGREIDDLEPSHGESRGPLDEDAFVVGPAVGKPLVHPLEHGGVGPPVGACQDIADDAAHGGQPVRSTPTVSRTW